MKTGWYKFLSNITLGSVYAAIFLVPVFFLPFTLDYLEINKFYLLYTLTMVGVLAWLAREALSKTVTIRRTPLDLPLLILWVAILVASILSENTLLSFFGNPSFLNSSLVFYSILLIFYFLVVQNLDSLQRIFTAICTLLASGLVASLYFILTATKLIPSFRVGPNLTSVSYTSLGLFLATILILSLTVLAMKKGRKGLDIFAAVVFVTTLAAIIMIGFKIALLVAGLGLFLLLVFFLAYIEEVRHVWVSLTFGLFLFILFFSVIGMPSFLTVRLPLEVSLGSATSWSLAYDSLTDNPRKFLFGSGPATFIYNFSKYRPAALNYNFAWNVRFQQPYSTAIDLLIQTGILGALAMVIVILLALGLIITTWLKYVLGAGHTMVSKLTGSSVKPAFIFWGLTASWLTILIALFLTGFGVASWFTFWLLFGLIVSGGQLIGGREQMREVALKTTPQYALVTSFFFILTWSALVVLSIYLGRFYAAEVVFASSFRSPSQGEAGAAKIASLQKAISLNENRVQILLALAETHLALAQEAANKKPADINQVASIIVNAVNTSKKATEKAPNDVATWESLATMYANARPIAAEANNWVITSLAKATALEPTNPIFLVGLANAKIIDRRFTDAQIDLEKAIGLKSDYLLARLRLAAVLEAQKKFNEAVEVLEKGLDTGLNNAQYLFELGRLYYNRRQGNDYGQAELALRRAVTLDPNYADALFALAVLYERTNNNAPALELYKRVLRLNPGNKDLQKKVNALSGRGEEEVKTEEKKK